MFSNQISARELFNGSQSTQDNYQNDFSQLQHAQFSQFDVSQPMSQDFFSQDQYSAGSNSQSQGRRGPAIDKYMTKPSLFRSNSQSKISTLSRPLSADNQALPRKSGMQPSSYQQQLSLQKQKAKERDERDMLSSIVSMVRECSEEVKHNVKCMRSAEVDNGEILQSSIKSLTESLEESSNRILKAIKEREEHSNQLVSLHKEIRQKDERIHELLESKKSSLEGESPSSSSLLESVKTFIVEQQSQTEQKVQRLLESMQEQLKLTKEIGTSHRSGVEENNKCFLDVKYTNARQVQDIEKRLIDELVTIRDDFTRQKRDLESFLRNQLHSTQQKHLHDIEEHVQKSMIEGLRHVSGKTDKLLDDRHAEMKAIGKCQQRDLEKYIKNQTADQTKQIIKQHQDMYCKEDKDVQKAIKQKLENLTADQKELIKENKDTLNELKNILTNEKHKPWQNDNVPKPVQDKLNELHNYHQSEIKRLEAEIAMQRKKNAEQKEMERKLSAGMDEMVNSNMQNVYDLQHDASTTEGDIHAKRSRGSVFKNGPCLLSPRPPQGTAWNSRMLFCRPNPSPVATVLPQRKPMQETIVTNKNAVQATQALQTTAESSEYVRQLRNRHIEKQVVPVHSIPAGGQNSLRVDSNGSGNITRQITAGSVAVDIADISISQGNTNKSQKKRGGRKNGRKRRAVKQSGIKIQTKTSKHSQELENSCNENECMNDSENQEEQSASSGVFKEKKLMSSRGREALNPKNVYDFRDELSPGPVLRKRISPNSVFNHQISTASDSKRKWSAASDTSSGDSSTYSSPSLSVTDIFILTNGQNDGKSLNTNEAAAEVQPASDGFAALSDFLSTPNLTELYTVENKVCVSTSKLDLKNVRQIRRTGEKRKLCDFQPQIQMIQHQKNRRH